MMRPLTNGPRPTTKDSLSRLDTEVIVCTRCPRLVEYRAEVARVKRRAYREWEYWGKPVPGFGDPKARVLVLGLALPSVLTAPADVPRASAGMFTISYSIAMVLAIVGGWLWDLTQTPVAGFVPAALCAIVVMGLASTANHPDHPENATS